MSLCKLRSPQLAWCSVDLTGKDADADRNRDVHGVEDVALVLPVELLDNVTKVDEAPPVESALPRGCHPAVHRRRCSSRIGAPVAGRPALLPAPGQELSCHCCLVPSTSRSIAGGRSWSRLRC